MIIGKTIIVASLQFTLDYALMIEIRTRLAHSPSHTLSPYVIYVKCAIA